MYTRKREKPCESYWGNVCSGFGGSLTCNFCGWERHEHPKKKVEPKNMYTETELLDLVDDWHNGDDPRELHEFLGWTWEQYGHWAETGEQPYA